MGVPFRSNSGGRLSNARRQSVDVSRMAEAPARAGGAGGAGGARPSALSATLGARARASDDRDAAIATATLGSLGFGVEGGAGEGGGSTVDWRVSARAEAATMSADGKRKTETKNASGGANGAPPRRNSSFTEGSSRDVGGWTSYNPATGPR